MPKRVMHWTEGDDAPIARLDLSVRLYNLLAENNIAFVGQLLALRKAEIFGIRYFTIRDYEEVRVGLIECGFMKPERQLGPFREDEERGGK